MRKLAAPSGFWSYYSFDNYFYAWCLLRSWLVTEFTRVQSERFLYVKKTAATATAATATTTATAAKNNILLLRYRQPNTCRRT